MRIVSGKYKSRRFEVPKSFKARPTTDFAKENLFNVLHNLIEWEEQCALDLFAGTGSIGFELLSRGCREVTAVEQDAQHCAFIRQVAQQLKDPAYRLVRADVFKFVEMQQGAATYDLVFADPPYALPELDTLPRLLLEGGVVAPGGMLILEHPGEYDFSTHPCFDQLRKYGSVHFSLFNQPQ